MLNILLSLAVALLSTIAAVAYYKMSHGWQPIAPGAEKPAFKVEPRFDGRYNSLLMREDLIRICAGSICMIILTFVVLLLWPTPVIYLVLPWSAVVMLCHIGDSIGVMKSQRPTGYQ